MHNFDPKNVIERLEKAEKLLEALAPLAPIVPAIVEGYDRFVAGQGETLANGVVIPPEQLGVYGDANTGEIKGE